MEQTDSKKLTIFEKYDKCRNEFREDPLAFIQFKLLSPTGKHVLVHLYTNEKVTPGQWLDRPPRLSRYFQLEDDGSLDVRMITDEFRLADIRFIEPLRWTLHDPSHPYMLSPYWIKVLSCPSPRPGEEGQVHLKVVEYISWSTWLKRSRDQVHDCVSSYTRTTHLYQVYFNERRTLTLVLAAVLLLSFLAHLEAIWYAVAPYYSSYMPHMR